MTRPEIIRADSIDLQDANAPSAQDHTRQPTHPGPRGVGPPAPHQAEALRGVAVETADQQQRSPRVSKDWSVSDLEQVHQHGDGELAARVTSALTGTNLHQQDALAVAQNGGLTGSTAEDAEMADGEGDDGMEDDMMDKISSSPSIDDGGYSLPHVWPKRSDSLSLAKTPMSSPSSSQACGESSSPFVDTPDFFPLRPPREPMNKNLAQGAQEKRYERHHLHHHLGEYLDGTSDSECGYEDEHADTHARHRSQNTALHIENYDEDYDLDCSSQASLARHVDLENEDNLLMTVPYESSEEEAEHDYGDDGDDDDDDDDDVPYADESRFVDSGWGGECLQESEDIDFEFVYALHTFVATVEGQANATKGDTMVLLDDSNSYWWLVRVVKDSSIGYLPAEHIETPTERLARLNKHRNIDLTSAMLGDQPEKSKNPLKKAIRRRNAKTVTFTAPTYVEASDIDYSTDEDEAEGDYYGQNGPQEQNGDQQEPGPENDEIAAEEPAKANVEVREISTDSTVLDADRGDATAIKASSDNVTISDEVFEEKLESSKSRNGTVRNTDSFFKDDSVETRKITLTPNLLRDDTSISNRSSTESKELKQRPSLDKLEKDSVTDKNKDRKDRKDKKEKDRKPGMLSGLFKRKDKKTKSQEEEIDEIMAGKRSTENGRVSPVSSKESDEVVTVEEQATAPTQEIQRQHSKLQKNPRGEMSPSRRPGQVREPKAVDTQQIPAPDRTPPAEVTSGPSMRLVQSDFAVEDSPQETRDLSPERTRVATSNPTSTKDEKQGGTISKILRSANSASPDPKPVEAKKSKSRVELDDSDSSAESSPVEEVARGANVQGHVQRPIPGSFPDSYDTTPTNERSNAMEERLSESPVQVSPVTSSQSYPPPLMVDTSSQEEPASPGSSPSPELIDVDDGHEKKGPGSSTTSTSTSAWSDTHLRTFFDDDADIKDLLVVVYDKSEVVPAGPDHPVIGNLFREENAKLVDITNRLDGMLGDWLSRKMRTQATR